MIPGMYMVYLSYRQALEEIHGDKNSAYQQMLNLQDVYISNLKWLYTSYIN